MRSRGRSLVLAVLLGACLELLQWHRGLRGQQLALSPLGPPGEVEVFLPDEALALVKGEMAEFAPHEEAAEAEETQEDEMMPRNQCLENLDVSAACVMLGFTVFVMSLFYLVNHHDDDIRQNSWEVISTTIAIFTSVLVFQGLDGIFFTFIVDNFVSHDTFEAFCPHALERQRLVCLISAAHLLFWFVCMHVVVARLTLAEKNELHQHSSSDHHALRDKEKDSHHSDPHEADMDQEQKIKCWATLLAHMTAFAAIGVSCDVQRMPIFAQNPLTCSVPVAIHILIMFFVFRLTDFIRNKACNFKGTATAVWDEECVECENEVAAISISYVTVRVVLYLILGEKGFHSNFKNLPVADRQRALVCIVFVLVSCAAFLAILFGWVRLMTKQASSAVHESKVPTYHTEAGFTSNTSYFQRWGYIALDTSGLCFAWCLLYAIRWGIQHTAEILELPLCRTKAISGICLAVCTSVAAFSLIFVINWLCGRRRSHDLMWKQFRSLIRSLGILIGFAWEQCFDAGAEAIAKQVGSEQAACNRVALARFAIASVIAAAVIPAWRHYILKIVLGLRHQK